MKVLFTIDDFPNDKANCGNCTRKGGACPRSQKRYPNGYIKNSLTGEMTGIIYCCPHYTGQYKH